MNKQKKEFKLIVFPCQKDLYLNNYHEKRYVILASIVRIYSQRRWAYASLVTFSKILWYNAYYFCSFLFKISFICF